MLLALRWQAAERRVRAIMARHGVYDAFELRAELINYKKALYHLYLEAMAVAIGIDRRFTVAAQCT